VTSAINTGNAYAVKAVSSSLLNATYTAALGTIDSLDKTRIPQFDGVDLAVGDYVLVRFGTINPLDPLPVENKAAIGVYVVTEEGDSNNSWRLTRADDFTAGLVIANQGTFRAAITGQGFTVGYDFLNKLPLSIVPDARGQSLQIGSGDVNDAVTFVVSTNLGTNLSVGSLGKMLTLSATNTFQVPLPDGSVVDQQQQLRFANNIGGTIQLRQELPQIANTQSIDARVRQATGGITSPIVIDGSRITARRNSRPVTTSDVVNGFEFVGDGASRSTLAGITMGGFTRGAAVVLDGASDILVNAMRFGEDSSGRKLANKVGVSVRNGAGGFNTVLNSTIRSGSTAGIQTIATGDSAVDGTTAIRVIGSTLGSAGFENVSGASIGAGNVLIGASPTTVSLNRLAASFINTTAANTFSVAANGLLREGLGVVSTRIIPPAGKSVATIQNIASDPRNSGFAIVTIDGSIDGVTAAMIVDIGLYGEPVDLDDLEHMRLPAGIDIRDIYLGQTLSGVNVAPNTVISGITADPAGGYILELSQPLLRADAQQVTFGTPGRTQLMFNNYGVLQTAGTSRVFNTTIGSSVFDGVKIDGGKATIGMGDTIPGVDGKLFSKDLTPQSNLIYGSGQAGIRVASSVTSTDVVIQGNYLGVTALRSVSANKLGNIVAAAALADRTLSGSVTKVEDNGATLTLRMNGSHGLSTGMFIYLRLGGATTGYCFKVTRLAQSDTVNSATDIRCELYGVTGTTVPYTATAANGATPATTVSAYLYGKKERATELALTASVDFEGNQHGVTTALPVKFSATSTTTPPSSSGTGSTAGRPVIRPIIRPVRR
jgi:hypothetical protein